MKEKDKKGRNKDQPAIAHDILCKGCRETPELIIERGKVPGEEKPGKENDIENVQKIKKMHQKIQTSKRINKSKKCSFQGSHVDLTEKRKVSCGECIPVESVEITKRNWYIMRSAKFYITLTAQIYIALKFPRFCVECE